MYGGFGEHGIVFHLRFAQGRTVAGNEHQLRYLFVRSIQGFNASPGNSHPGDMSRPTEVQDPIEGPHAKKGERNRQLKGPSQPHFSSPTRGK
jgi:hypothetical protein